MALLLLLGMCSSSDEDDGDSGGSYSPGYSDNSNYESEYDSGYSAEDCAVLKMLALDNDYEDADLAAAEHSRNC